MSKPEIWITHRRYEHGAIAEVLYVIAQTAIGITRNGHQLWVDPKALQRTTPAAIVGWIKQGQFQVCTGLVVTWPVEKTDVFLYQRGADVQPTDDGRFITTEADGRTYNNLEHLPDFPPRWSA